MEIGDRIDGWVVEQRLGAGGMGSVYRCRNVSTDRILAAVKVLERPLRGNTEAHQRFVREAEILARLDHPGIVRVRNVRIESDPPYLEMEFVDGRSLEEHIRDGRVAYNVAVDRMLQLVEAVAYLHARGVRHRDLKPANVLVDPAGRVKIVDFGLAMETDLERITAEGLNFGTVSYAPPEWIDPERLDPVQWDLYALGVMFHEMLTGLVAFPMSGEGPLRKQLLQVMMGKQRSPPLDPGPEVPERARLLVTRLTDADPARRPASADELLQLVRALPTRLGDESATIPLTDPRISTPGMSAAPMSLVAEALPARRSRAWLMVPAGIVAAIALGGLVALGVVRQGWNVPEPLPVPPPDPPVVVAPVPPTLRSVSLAVGDVALPVRVFAGDVEAIALDGVARLAVPFDTTELTWVCGTDCTDCPGPECGSWCGSGVVPLPPGQEAVSLAATLTPGLGQVTITLPVIQSQTDGGRFKKKKPIWHVEVELSGGRGFLANHWTAKFQDVAPGRHEVFANVGGCSPEANGCWPDGACPAKCRSGRGEVIVPWEGGNASAKIRVPPPE